MWQDCKALQGELVTIRRDLHKIPEIQHSLPKTKAYVLSKLEEYGISYRCSKTDDSVIAEVVGDPKGKVIVLRADMDALPIVEDTQVDYQSTHPGCMHACGHDAHAAMLLGAAKVLKSNESQLKGTVRFLFQTAEEIAKGAEIMIADGALENASAIFGIHIGSILGKEYATGSVVGAPGCVMASMDKFTVNVTGVGCHGSTPEKGVDPINIASHIVISLQAVIAREFSATRPVVLTIGKIAGGDAFNIIPNQVVLEGTIRAIDQKEREKLAQRIDEISAQVALTFGGTAVTEMIWGAPPVVNHANMAKLACDAAAKVLGEDMVIRSIPAPNMGGEDFAYYVEKIPGAFLFLNSANVACGSDVPHHNAKFKIDEDVLWEGSAVFVASVQDFFDQN